MNWRNYNLLKKRSDPVKIGLDRIDFLLQFGLDSQIEKPTTIGLDADLFK